MSGDIRLVPPLALLVLALGCGEGKKNYTLVPVSGRVTMDEKPLAHAEVRFVPAGKDLPSSEAVTDEDGHYKLHLESDNRKAGAVAGDFRVEISQDARKDKKLMMMKGGKGPMKAPGEMLPAKYNRDSKLTCNVPAEGKQDANFDLKSK